MEFYTEEQVDVLKNVIGAQQEVITAWESAFNSVAETILNVVRQNVALKVMLLKQTDPDIELPDDIYAQMDALKHDYHNGTLSALTYFEALDGIVSAVIV